MKPIPNPKAIASLVLGILSVICILYNWFLVFGGDFEIGIFAIGAVTSVIGMVLGIAANKEAKSGMGTAGIVLGAISLAYCVIFIVACVACIATCISWLGDLADLYPA